VVGEIRENKKRGGITELLFQKKGFTTGAESSSGRGGASTWKNTGMVFVGDQEVNPA